MGFSVTWCAVREEAAETFLAGLGLSPTDETEEIPCAELCMAKLDSGWRVVWFNEFDSPYLRRERLPDLSAHGDLVVCAIGEQVMTSSAELWCRGGRTWWLSHEGEDGPMGFSGGGDLPEAFPAIRDEMVDAQRDAGGDDADVDYLFEIPLKVAESVVGFKHDEKCTHLI